MKTLILYASKYGATEKCANLLAEKLNDDVEIINVNENKSVSLSNYDRIIVGTSIYAGNVQAKVKSFCANNIDLLMSKPFSIFLSCMTDKKFEIQSYVDKAFTKELINHATIIDSLGGVFNFNKMNFFEKLVIKMIGKSQNKFEKLDGKTNISTISDEKISKFARSLDL